MGGGGRSQGDRRRAMAEGIPGTQRIPPHGAMDVAARVMRVRARIAEAATRSGRRPEEITLVAVTKGVDVARIREALASGITDLGENRVQEAIPKVAAVGRALRWHMVGHLQRNKVRDAVSLFDVIQSLDSQRLAVEISERAVRPIEVLLQVNVAGEAQKFGLPPEAVLAVAPDLVALPGLRIIGLMTIAPQANDPEEVRPVFRRLRELRDALAPLRSAQSPLTELSMGMSEDFDVAVAEGATIVRIGRAVFGARQ